jgi:hypothetical protein
MITNRLFYLLIVIAMLVVTACAPQVAVTTQPTSAPVATVTQASPGRRLNRMVICDREGENASFCVQRHTDTQAIYQAMKGDQNVQK